MSIPRIILLGVIFIISLVFSFIKWTIALKWWILFLILVLALFLAIPRTLLNKRLFVALFELPYSFLLMFCNLFRLKGANKNSFIHLTE